MFELCLGQLTEMSKPELLVGFCGLLALSCFGIWAIVRWFLGGPCRPDPWDSETAAELAKDDCTPLCHHCLSPHDLLEYFCPQCGAAVGPYTNLLPYPYVFSLGHALRIGTSEKFKQSPLTVVGFIIFSCVEYSVFAPVYWFRLSWASAARHI
jgi:hypothetical protein